MRAFKGTKIARFANTRTATPAALDDWGRGTRLAHHRTPLQRAAHSRARRRASPATHKRPRRLRTEAPRDWDSMSPRMRSSSTDPYFCPSEGSKIRNKASLESTHERTEDTTPNPGSALECMRPQRLADQSARIVDFEHSSCRAQGGIPVATRERSEWTIHASVVGSRADDCFTRAERQRGGASARPGGCRRSEPQPGARASPADREGRDQRARGAFHRHLARDAR